MHQMQRDAYNTLQTKLKETITKTKQPWRDDHLTRLEKPFSGTDPLWNTPNHVSTASFPSYDSSIKWHSPSLAQPVATHDPKLFNQIQPVAVAPSNHHYFETLPIESHAGAKAVALGQGEPVKAVETLHNQGQNHYKDTVEQPPIKPLETPPSQNHFDYIVAEQGQSTPEETLPNPHQNHLNYLRTEHSQSIPQETLPVSNEDNKNYARAKHINSKPFEELPNPNQDRLSYINSENVQSKPMETHQNSDKNHAGAKHTESKPLEALLRPSSDNLDYIDSEQIQNKRLEKLPIPSQDDFSYMNAEPNIPSQTDTPSLPTVIAPNEDQKLATSSTPQPNLQQVKIDEKNENDVNSGNFTIEVFPNGEEHTTEKVQNPSLKSPAAIVEKPETVTETPQPVIAPNPVKTPESYAVKLQKHSKNLAEKMKNLNDRKKDLDEMVASIINMERASPTTDPAAQKDLQKIMDSIQAYNKHSKHIGPAKSPTAETQHPQYQPIQIPQKQNSGTQLVQALYEEKPREGVNSPAEIIERPVEKTRNFPSNGRISPRRMRPDPLATQPEIFQIQQNIQQAVPQWSQNVQQAIPQWSQNIQQAVPQWVQNRQQSVESLKAEKPPSKLSRTFKNDQLPQATTSPYDVILLKDKAKTKDTVYKPAKKLDYSFKFQKQPVKPEEPYQIIEETINPSTTESPEERLIKLLASSAEPEVIEEIRHEMKELKRFLSEEGITTTVRPSVEGKPKKSTNPNMISTKDKIIVPFDHQHPKIIMIDPNELHSQQIQFVEKPSKQNRLGDPVFSFAGGDPFENDELAKSAPETESSEDDEETEDYQEEKTSPTSLPKNFPWNLYYPNIGATLNKTQTDNKSELERNPAVLRNSQAPVNEAVRKNFDGYQQKAAENYERLVREREERLKNLRESYKKPTIWSKNPGAKAYPTKSLSRLSAEQPLSQNFPQYARNYPYDPTMVQGTPIESNQHYQPHLPEKRSCNCGKTDPIEAEENLTLPSNSLSDCPCRNSKPSQATRNDLSDFITEQRKGSDKKEKAKPVVAPDCSSDESSLESKEPPCGCPDSSESDEEMPKSRQAKSCKTCACGLSHDDDDCGPCNALRSPRSDSEPNKYEILNNVLLWFKRFAKKGLEP